MKRWSSILASAAGVAAAVAVVCAVWVYSLGPAPLGKNLEYSHVVLDREGRTLARLCNERRTVAATGHQGRC